jgi:hypothetical protein
MRVSPSCEQLIADSLNWSEQLRTASLAGCDDVLGFVAKICKMPSFMSTARGDVPISTVTKMCNDWGLRWQGKAIERNTWTHMQCIMPFAGDEAVITAIGEIKRMWPEVDKLTVVGKVCKAASSFIKGGFIIEEFQDSRAPTLALRYALTWFQLALLFGDVEKKQVHGNFLVGDRATDVGIMQVHFRKLQGLDVVWKHYRSSAAYSPEVGNALWEKFSSPLVFANSFAADDFWKKDWEAGFVNGQKGLGYWTTEKFQKFCAGLPGQTSVALAELLYGHMTSTFDMQYLANAQNHADGSGGDLEAITSLLRGSNGDALSVAFKKYTGSLACQAVPLDQDAEIQPLADFGGPSLIDLDGDGHEDNINKEWEEKKQLFEKVLADKDARVRFHALPTLPAGPAASFMNAAELNMVLANCPFHSPAKKLGPKEKAKCKAWILSAELFPGCLSGGPSDFRLPPRFFQEKKVPDSLKSLWKWMLSVRHPDDLIVVFDGRFSQVRRFFDEEMAKLNQSFLMDLWIIYATPKDIRYTTRERAYSNCNREVILVYRPVTKKKSTCVARQGFNSCGEKSSFDMTYSGVQLRSLGELPKLTAEDKKKMLGTDADVPLSYPGEKDQSMAAEGVPFAWGETKPVAWWAAFFKDLAIDEVFDVTCGSAGAAIGAHYANVQYDGICCNALHQKWCQKLMKQAMFAIIADGGGGSNPEFIKKIMHFFGPSVDEGMRMLKAAKEEKKQEHVKKDNPGPEGEDVSDSEESEDSEVAAGRG